MHKPELKDRFVELRAQRMSFVSISKELGVSKTTLIDWSREMREQIANMKAINQEALLEQYSLTKKHKLKILSKQLSAIEKELEKRGLDNVSTDKLYGILLKLVEKADQEHHPLMFQRSQDGVPMDDMMYKTTWNA